MSRVMSQVGRRGRRAWLALAPLAALGLAGCNETAAKPPPPKPAVVLVDTPTTREVTDYEDFVGQTTPVKLVELRARVTGYLDKINFTDGDEVAEGAVLFEIDPRPYTAEANRTKAALDQAEALLRRTTRDLDRAKGLAGRDAVSRQEYDKFIGDQAEAAAAVGVAKANNETALLNLSFTKVTAPIAGRLSRRQVDPGNLVKADETALTTIVAPDPIYVNFDVDERTMLRYQKLIREGKVKSRSEAEVPIYAALADDADFPYRGTINFSENRLDPGTGTLRVRAQIPNPKPRVLTPGLFMRVRLPVGVPRMAMLIPEQAVGTDQGQKFLYVVDAKNVVNQRPIQVGVLTDGLRVVDKGLAAGERVIVSGLQRVRPKAVVDPKPAKEPASAVAGETKAAAKAPAGG